MGQITRNIFTPDQKWWTGVVKAGIYGGLLGGITGAVGYGLARLINRAPAVTELGKVEKFGEMPTKPGYQRHHLFEKRFAEILGVDPDNIPTVYVTHEQHVPITNDWRTAIGYSRDLNPLKTTNATIDNIVDAMQGVYADMPQVLKVLDLWIRTLHK
jgi:hypothetical protein